MNGAELVVLGSLFVLSVMDLRTRKISWIPVALLGGVALIYQWCAGELCIDVIVGIIPGLILIGLAFCTKESIGYGDGLVLGVLGLYCGIKKAVAVLGMALLLAAVLAMVLLVLKKAGRKTELPFLPCLCSGYLLCLLW
ncbi:MAG: prepilin peptidase [Lachnospiraceae bacterium]|nr:prepilin peptidase [Lachnospiraceae bacterium]